MYGVYFEHSGEEWPRDIKSLVYQFYLFSQGAGNAASEHVSADDEDSHGGHPSVGGTP